MMTFQVRLLIVEDDEPQQKDWENTIEMHNADVETYGFSIKDSYAKSLSDARALLEKCDFDAAIIDIRLAQDAVSAPNEDGNVLIEELLDSELAVIAVFTGESAIIPKWAESIVHTFRKGAADDHEGTSAVMKWLCGQNPMIQSIRQAQFTIRKEMVKQFTRSIWPRWNNWIQDSESSEDRETALSRHLISHVHAVLLEGTRQKAHPEEWYFIPPIRDGIRTGDIIQTQTGTFEIVITPRCDLAHEGKATTIQLAECKIVADEWKKRADKITQSKAALEAATEDKDKENYSKQLKDAEYSLRNYTQHSGGKASVHFLPAMKLPDGNTLGPFMVQFDTIRSLAASDAIKSGLLETRIAALTPEFLPSLVERLGGFFSRIGTPDYSHPD